MNPLGIALVYFALSTFSTEASSENEIVIKRRLVAKRRSPMAKTEILNEKYILEEQPVNKMSSETRNHLIKSLISGMINQPDKFNNLIERIRGIDPIVSKPSCEKPLELPRPPPLICLPHELEPFTTTGKHSHFYDSIDCATVSTKRKKPYDRAWPGRK